MIFPKILRELREKKGISQRELSEILNLSKNSISHYETSKNYPSLDTLVLIADYFDVSTDYLLGRSTSKIIHSKLISKIGRGTNAGDLIETILNLDYKHQEDLLMLLEYIKFHNKVLSEKK